MTRKNNSLLAPQRHAVNKWLEARQDEMRGKARPDIAVVATAELGFTVTANNILGAEAATGLQVGRIATRRPAPQAGSIQQFLATALLELTTQLGNTPDPRLSAIASGAEA